MAEKPKPLTDAQLRRLFKRDRKQAVEIAMTERGCSNSTAAELLLGDKELKGVIAGVRHKYGIPSTHQPRHFRAAALARLGPEHHLLQPAPEPPLEPEPAPPMAPEPVPEVAPPGPQPDPDAPPALAADGSIGPAPASQRSETGRDIADWKKHPDWACNEVEEGVCCQYQPLPDSCKCRRHDPRFLAPKPRE